MLTPGPRASPFQEFLYYQEKLPEFAEDEELSSLMCVCSYLVCAYP